ncbi:MAG: hypothetical protein FWH53_02915 [Leptospirales bacterium]|nr:hypothetical protein [Leptospirales bacterium]
MNLELPTLKQGLTFSYESKCYKNKKLFKGDNAKRYFLDAIKSCQKKHTFKLLAAKMDSNRIHLLIRTIEKKESIIVIMFSIMDMIEEMYNRDTGRSDLIWDDVNRMSIVEESKDPKQYLSELNKFFRKAEINNIAMEDINNIEHVENIQDTTSKIKLKASNF